MNKYGLIATFKAKEGKTNELLELLRQASEAMSELEGCHLYVVGKNKTEPETIRVFEVWDSEEDHDESLNDPRAKELISKALPLLAGQPESAELDVVGGLDS